MPQEKNRSIDVEIRKRRDILRVSGAGIIAFAVWTAIKLLALFFLNRADVYKYMVSLMDTGIDARYEKFVIYFIYAVFALMVLIAILIEVYVGRSAIAEGKGRRRRGVYLFFACIMLIFSVFSVAADLFGGQTESEATSYQTSAIVEATMMILLADMVYSAIKVRKLTPRDGYVGKHMKG